MDKKMKNDCEFCEEIIDSKIGSFYKIYNGIPSSRIIYEDDNFVILPTIGQLFKYSLLVLPRKHVERLADLENNKLILLEEILLRTKSFLGKYGSVVAFEHGAKCETKGGCGIYHAHMHIIPLPEPISLSNFFKHDFISCNNLVNGLETIKNSSEYLLSVNYDNTCAVLDISKYRNEYPSQFLRQELCRYFNLTNSWNWKDYNFTEDWLLSSINDLALKV